jgi:hypothetical protein
MNKILLPVIISSVFAMQAVQAQPTSPGIPLQPPIRLLRAPGQQSDSSELSRFSLDFPGGTPNQLTVAIEKATGKPLNVIVPEEFAGAKLPPIKVTDVTVPQLFDTLQTGSRRYFNDQVQSSYGFTSNENSKNDNTIWTFSVYTNQASGQLTKFSIDFPGGSPKDLIAAIQKASGHPLNVIVPEEYADTKMPPLKMNDVDVSQLFHALELASMKTEPYVTATIAGGGYQSYQQKITGYGFKTDGKVTNDSVWYFHVDKIPAPPGNPPEKACRFYALAPYLDRGLKVDDITTAVETAWKMSGETAPPAISFHKDTQLLIAVGDPKKLQMIDSILQALQPSFASKVKEVMDAAHPPAEKKSDATKTGE